MALALGDVIQVSLRGTLYGQRILNVLHYSVAVAGSGTDFDQIDILTSNLVTGGGSVDPLVPFLNAIAPQYQLEEVRAQRVYPTRTIYAYTIDGRFGTYATGTETTNIAASLEKRTLTPGRMGIGRIQIAGVPTAAMDNGECSAAYKATELTDLAQALLLSITTSGPVVTYTPCLFNPTSPGAKFSPLFSIVVKDTLRTMRRRTVRLGE
jgi:hypothetical protein